MVNVNSCWNSKEELMSACRAKQAISVISPVPPWIMDFRWVTPTNQVRLSNRPMWMSQQTGIISIFWKVIKIWCNELVSVQRIWRNWFYWKRLWTIKMMHAHITRHYCTNYVPLLCFLGIEKYTQTTFPFEKKNIHKTNTYAPWW